MTETQTPLGQNAPESADTVSAKRRWFVGCAICAVAVLFCVLVSIVWYRSSWLKPAVPASLLVIQGSKDFEGTSFVVEGTSLPGPLQGTIQESRAYACDFRLPAGRYSVYVTFPDGLRGLEQVYLAEHQITLMSRVQLEEYRKRLNGRRFEAPGPTSRG